MPIKHIVKLFIFFFSLSVSLFAIEGRSKVYIKSSDTIYTSQKITVSVELLTDAFSITDAKITFPASQKYIVQAPQSASYLGSEEINGTDWQMVHYEYEVYALQSGQIDIPSVNISFTASMGYGQPKKEFNLESDAVHFDVKTLKGMKKDQFVLVTDSYTLVSKIKPEKKQLIVGDAVELSVIQEAHHVPDILLRPVHYTSNTFLRVYTKEPELKSGLKGKNDVSRIDRFTFVATGEGNATLPRQELVWWNSMTQKIQVETIPEIFFEILPDPQIAIDAKKAEQKQRLLYVSIILILLFILYVLFASKIRNYLNERKRIYVLSEPGKFSALLTCIDENDTKAIYQCLYDWLISIDPLLARVGFRGIEKIQPSFLASLRGLETTLSIEEKSFDRIDFINELKKLRVTLLKEQQEHKQGLPNKINPI
jgi:hypothetical protein